MGLAAGAGMLAGCTTPGTNSVNTAPVIPPATEPVRLTYWAWLKDLQATCDIWNAANPNIQVEAVWIPGGNSGGYQKLFSALAAGGGPDLGQVEFRSTPEFMLVNGLVDVARYGAQDSADKFDPTLWGQVSFVGGVFGIPQDSGPMGTYFRPDLLKAVGAQAPTTWDEWAEIAAELRKTNVYIDVFPLADASWFASIATQAGASWLKVDGDSWVINMTDDATLNTARFFDKAIDDDLVNTAFGHFSTPWFAAAANNQLASMTSASWADALLGGVSGASGKWRVAAMPRWGSSGFGSSYLGGSTVAVMANSQHPYEALQFATWMSSSKEGVDSLIANSGIGWSPAVDYIGAQRMQPSEFFGGQNYNEEVFLPATKEQNPNWTWWPLTTQSLNIITDGFRRKASGGTLVDAIVDAESRIIVAFENRGLSIRRADS